MLVNHHSVGDLAGDVRRQLGRFFGFLAVLLFVDMRLETLVEIVHAHAGVDDGQDDEDKRDDGEEGERSLGRQID